MLGKNYECKPGDHAQKNKQVIVLDGLFKMETYRIVVQYFEFQTLSFVPISFQSHHLRALHYVPDIMGLQHQILQQLRHRLNRVDAKDITIQEMMDRTGWACSDKFFFCTAQEHN